MTDASMLVLDKDKNTMWYIELHGILRFKPGELGSILYDNLCYIGRRWPNGYDGKDSFKKSLEWKGVGCMRVEIDRQVYVLDTLEMITDFWSMGKLPGDSPSTIYKSVIPRTERLRELRKQINAICRKTIINYTFSKFKSLLVTATLNINRFQSKNDVN